MRAGSRSRTSDWVAALRALYSEAPAELAVLDDAVAERLLPPGLRVLVRSAARLPLGTRALHRLIGAATQGLSYGVPLRTAAIDDAVRRSVAEGIRQLVLLGAGLDARAWRMPALAETKVFELDHPSTQAYKREHTRDLRPLARDVRFCAIDFEQQTIADVLEEQGFATGAPSVWVWEGVTMYLTQDAVEATLDAVRELSAPKSRLAMTYLPRRYAAPWIQTVSELGARLIGEELRALQDPDEVRRRLDSRGFSVESDEGARDWASRWPPAERDRVRDFERLAVARRDV
jgi:methyltransferase (TIGR00027 family)